jgi:peptide/nickel transport system ATP-binding protein
MNQQEYLVEVKGLRKHFPVHSGLLTTLFSRSGYFVHAVDDISFTIKKGEIFGLVGESGSGKTTTGRLLVKLVPPTSGDVLFRGKEVTKLEPKYVKPYRRRVQIIFQDPYESLNPRMIIKEIVAEPIRVQKAASSEAEVEERVKQALRDVELVPPEEFLRRFPHELSGGQRQRVAVARAFVLNPEFVVADEPVSMLDVSIRAEILNLMVDLVEKRGTSILYITHDLALAKHLCDRVAVMYLGQIVEIGPTETIIGSPMHPYTKALISAVPVPDPSSKRIGEVISGEIPSPIFPPPGCRFNTRCPYAHTRCIAEEPNLLETEEGHKVACHLYS